MRFGRYVLLDKLAVGGMAELFLAKMIGEAGFERTCVIKRVLPHLNPDAAFVAMFLDEGRIAARLHHPGIVQIYDLGKEGDAYFLAMEYLAGEDLAAILKRAKELGRQLPIEVAVALIARAAEALHFAHTLRDERGHSLRVVHCDISPSNLMLTYSGVVKVLDFGIARAGRRLDTNGGQVYGKRSYLSPEQAEGKSFDPRTDVWSLGVCLHELLTGKPLFRRATPEATHEQLMGGTIPAPSDLRPEIPPALNAITLRALARPLAARWSTAGELADALDAFLVEHRLPSPNLGRFLSELFGADRAQEKLGRALVQDDLTELQTQRLPEGPARPLAHPAEGPATFRPRPRWRNALLGALALMVAAPVLGVGWLSRSPAPSSGVPTPPPVPVAVAPQASPLQPSKPLARVDPLPPPGSVPSRTAVLAPPKPKHISRAPPKSPPAKSPKVPSRGILVLNSAPPAEVFEAGRSLGFTPLRADLPAGEHELQLTGPHAQFGRLLHVVVSPEGETQERATFGHGQLEVEAVPWADVFLDGKRLGATPLPGRSLWEGAHTLRLVGPHGEKTLQIQVVAGETKRVRERVP